MRQQRESRNKDSHSNWLRCDQVKIVSKRFQWAGKKNTSTTIENRKTIHNNKYWRTMMKMTSKYKFKFINALYTWVLYEYYSVVAIFVFTSLFFCLLYLFVSVLSVAWICVLFFSVFFLFCYGYLLVVLSLTLFLLFIRVSFIFFLLFISLSIDFFFSSK